MADRTTDLPWPTRRGAVVGGLAALATCHGRPAQAQAEGIGHVLSLRGQAFAENGGARRRLDLRGRLFLNDLLITGAASRLKVRLGRRTTLALGENARLRIDRQIPIDDSGDYELQAGPLFLEHDEEGPRIPATVRSPYGLIAVRSTQFFAGPSNNVFGVFAARDRVSVQAAGQSVLLDTGEGTSIARPGDPPGPPVPWGQARIRAALASVQ